MNAAAVAPRIGVFDSGVGGLTVLRALRTRLPGAHYLYMGDTARLPYGSKSQATVARYAVESARFLLEAGAEYLVIACNTASALALPEVRAAIAPVRALGVIEAGADAARQASVSGEVCVLATAATVASHAYAAACAERGLRAVELACPLLVPLVEEGWTEHRVTREVMAIYLAEAAAAAEAAGLRPDALVLGCTHYPLLRDAFARMAPPGTTVIDSAEVTAEQVARAFRAQRTGVRSSPGEAAETGVRSGDGLQAGRSQGTETARPPIRFFATDGTERFRALGSRFLGEPIEAVELIDLGG